MKNQYKFLFISALIFTLAQAFGPAHSAIPQFDSMNSEERTSAEGLKKENDQISEVTRQLREAILADTQLSNRARNVKITTIQSAIILEGRVSSRAEKVKIENLARARAGSKKVYNRLTY